MSYLDTAQISTDAGLRSRVVACGYTEKIPNPEQWAANHAWDLATQPGWSDAWAYARNSGETNIGSNEGVITDGMILSAVQSLYAAENVQATEAAPEEGGAA